METNKKLMGREFVNELIDELRSVDFEEYFKAIVHVRNLASRWSDSINDQAIENDFKYFNKLKAKFGDELAEKIFLAQIGSDKQGVTANLTVELFKIIGGLVGYKYQQRYAYMPRQP